MPPVFLIKLFSHGRRIGDILSGYFIFQTGQKNRVQHIDLALHGDKRIVIKTVPDCGPPHDPDSVFKSYFLFRDGHSFQIPAEIFQIMKPLIASFDPDRFFIFPDVPDMVNIRIPVLIEETYKELFHRHLRDSVYVQIRQHTGDIVQKDPVAPYDVEVLRTEIFFIIIQNIRDAVHRYCCFSRSGDTLHNQVHLRRSSDHCVLFLLDRGDDLTEYRAFISGKILCQQLIVCYHVRVKEIDQPVVRNLIGALPLQVDLAGTFIFYSISASPCCVLVIDRCDGGSPVDDYRFGSVSGNADASDIV